MVLAVNVASKCCLTPQYEGLQKLQDELEYISNMANVDSLARAEISTALSELESLL